MLLHRLAVLVLFLGAGIPALAQGPIPGDRGEFVFIGEGGAGLLAPGQIPDAIVDRVKAALSLSDTQVTAVKALLNIRLQMNQEVMREMQQTQQALQNLLAQSNPNPTDVGNAFLATRAVQEKLQYADEKFRTDFTALLSAAQRTALENLKTASSQIEALRMMGLLDGPRGSFTMAAPPFPPLIGPVLPGGQFRIERGVRVPQ